MSVATAYSDTWQLQVPTRHGFRRALGKQATPWASRCASSTSRRAPGSMISPLPYGAPATRSGSSARTPSSPCSSSRPPGSSRPAGPPTGRGRDRHRAAHRRSGPCVRRPGRRPCPLGLTARASLACLPARRAARYWPALNLSTAPPGDAISVVSLDRRDVEGGRVGSTRTSAHSCSGHG